MDQKEEKEVQENFEAWLRETWGGSDPFSFLMRAKWSHAYDQFFDISVLSAIEERERIIDCDRLPIDDEIDRIRRSGSNEASQHIKSFRTLGCPTSMAPYIYSRIVLDQAIRIAAMRPPKDENTRSAELSKILENLRAARSAVHTCLVFAKSRRFPTGESGLPWEERAGRSRKVFDAEETMAASLPAMDFIIEGVEADLARLAVSAGRPKDEWKALFVAALALGWERLTGKLPGRTTAGGDFVNFLTAAWASLPGGEPPEINWERPILRGLRWAQTISREIAGFAQTHPEEAKQLSADFWREECPHDRFKLAMYYGDPFFRLRERAKL
jgi:hypothetical protein